VEDLLATIFIAVFAVAFVLMGIAMAIALLIALIPYLLMAAAIAGVGYVGFLGGRWVTYKIIDLFTPSVEEQIERSYEFHRALMEEVVATRTAR